VADIHTDDFELIDLFLSGTHSEEAFNLIVKKYQKQVYATIRKMVIDHDDTNDLVQNTFIKAWKNLSNFNKSSKLFTWLYRIAVNETITFLNTRKKRNLIPFSTKEYDLSEKLESDPWFDGDEAQKKFQAALLTLPHKQKLVFNMRYYDDMPYEQMSEILDTSEGALKASYHHAAKKIHDYLMNH
jgi:RNA polymerase sigma-70 factor (ECF subfamily)